MTSLAGIARGIQRAANRRDLVRRAQDRDQILAALHAGTARGAAAVERFAAAAAELAVLEAELEAGVTELRRALDDLTPGQGSGQDKDRKPNRTKAKK